MEASRIGGKSVFDYFTLPRPLGMMHYANRYPKVNARHTRGRNTDNDSDTTRNQESVKKTYPVLYLTERSNPRGSSSADSKLGAVSPQPLRLRR
ncbi:hypothetical protein RRG08_018899 [Elysia crispata]|uniref:Uncharacterized protein n=1 Tax=Elysia crispata TaxID=231223 RepID=A0AAE1A8P8_9GAST|nr:hypothetical protein RRG08_018899 [Elysia crispata]